MAFTTYLDTQLLTHVLGSSSYTKPSSVYIALFVGDPLSGGTEISTSGTGYARQVGTFTVSGNSATNNSNLSFPAATSNWGTITHIAIYDASTAGNQLITAALTASKSINAGDILAINSSNLTVSLT